MAMVNKNNLLYAAMLGLLATSCKEAYDLDERLPEGYGTTLYSYLSENGFNTARALADDLGYADVLQGRGLKTLFLADDDAYARFFANNKWGVRQYSDLSKSQKKLLFYGSMLDQSIQTMNLSNTTSETGVVTGNAMRRNTGISMYDSVPNLKVEDMPDNPYWAYYRKHRIQSQPMYCMKDATVAPLTFFTEPFLVQNRITNDDVNFLYNKRINRQAGDANVADAVVIEQNLRSANGFVHKVDKVLTPSENMAEVLRTTPELSMWSKFIDRFCVPMYAGRTATTNFNAEYGVNTDSLFVMRYLSHRTDGSSVRSDAELLMPPMLDSPVEAALKYDPGWNAYFTSDYNAASVTVATQKDMAVMLVPDNEALNNYWENGVGKVLKDSYGSWENVPDRVLVKLLNNNMLNSFVNSVPSKFASITNSTQDPMNITPNDVKNVILTGNCAIYVTQDVFSPTEYVSVSFPALVNSNMSIINWAIEQLQYSPYLNSIDSYYSFFIPTNEALYNYVDPYSWSKPVKEMWHFYYKANATQESERVWAGVYAYDPETGEVGDSIREERGQNVLDRLKDILENHIVVGNIESGREYYQTKNGNTLRVVREGGKVVGVQGSMQSADMGGHVVTIGEKDVYDQSEKGNGKSYILKSEPMLTTRCSAMDVIDAGDNRIFLELLQGSELYKNAGAYSVGDIMTLNNFNYTVYVPCDAAMAEYMSVEGMKTWEQIAEMEEDEQYTEEQVQEEKDKINNFLRYHIQDNAVYIGQEFAVDGSVTTLDRYYETAVMNEETNKFYTIRVQADAKSITLTDALGNTRKVQTSDAKLYNQPAREMGSNSFAVVHVIDRPLLYVSTQAQKYKK